MAVANPSRARKPTSALRDFLNLSWWVPLVALPFALFFMFMQGAGWAHFKDFFLVSLVFSAAVNLFLWVTDHVLRPQVLKRLEGDARASLYIAGVNLVMSVLGALVALLVINATIVPGFIHGARDLTIGLVWSVMFAIMFVGAALSIRFYRKAVERAGSDRELQLARRIQRSFLLSEFPRRPRIECHAENVSSKEVSGDFYDVVTPNDAEILLAIADVSGKGVPAALLSSMLQASLRTQAGAVASPAAIMRTMNSLACQRTSTGQFATFFLAAIHEPTMTLRYTNGGHNFPLLLRADGSRRTLEVGGTVIGMLEEMPFEEEAIELRTGDRLVVYTDGVTEAARADQEMFGEDRLIELLEGCPRDASAEQLVKRVLDGVSEFLGEIEPGDDITVMALRVLPGAS
jgi:serine phosphatase RsbU (regulator of sigma subunit)